MFTFLLTKYFLYIKGISKIIKNNLLSFQLLITNMEMFSKNALVTGACELLSHLPYTIQFAICTCMYACYRFNVFQFKDKAVLNGKYLMFQLQKIKPS